MGVKPKKDQKNVPEPPPSDEVTELEKQVFEIQLADITQKINRLVARQEELRQQTAELENKTEEHKKENEVVIAEHEQLLAMREDEKIEKRAEAIRLAEEIKVRVEKHKKHIENLEKRYEDMVKEKTKIVEILTEQARVLEDFKQNRDGYMAILEKYEKHMSETEVEHQRMLFNIERKAEVAKVRLKKELESRLLNLSIDFQEVYQKQIGDSCHRMTLENKAIESELKIMGEELADYREKRVRCTANVGMYKMQHLARKMEKDKSLARTVLQKVVIQDLLKDRTNVLEHLSQFAGLEVEHKNYLKKLRSVEAEKHRQMMRMKELNKTIEEREEEAEKLDAATKALRKNYRKLQILVRNGHKIVDEASALRLIPAGGMEEEKFLTNEAKVRLWKKRRETVFQKKGKILQYAMDNFAKAQFTEEDLKLLQATSTDSLNLEAIDFTLIYGRVPGADKEMEHRESTTGSSLVFGYHLTSDASLPRSVSELIQPKAEEEEEEESMEGEAEEVLEVKGADSEEMAGESPAEGSQEAGEEDDFAEESSAESTAK